MTLAGCATSSSALDRALPPAPDYARPVDVADPVAGEDALAVAARERAGRVAANRVIGDFSKWYSCVRAGYANGALSKCP